ncbi:MAG: hypothetical protein ACYTAF_02100 [Planctomycetota bacterium]|jgi:hypothetical protein
MAAKAEKAEFTLVITGVDVGRLEEAAQKFSAAFGLDAKIAQQIVKSAPIIFATGLTKSEVKAISAPLKDLSGQGMEFQITAAPPKKTPKVNWPIRPQFTAGGMQGVAGVAFHWDNNAFVCPSCGETFLFRRLGRLEAAEGCGEDAQDVDPGSDTAKVAVQEAPPAKPAVRKLDPPDEPEVKEAKEVAQAEEVQDLSLDEIEFADPAEEEQAGAPAPELDLAEPRAAEEKKPPEPKAPEPKAAVPTVPAPAKERLPTGKPPGKGGGDLYNVFLSKISDKKKQKKAAEVIAQVKGCSAEEAQDLASRLVIPLAKNVSKRDAEAVLTKFKKLKIFGRMTRIS